MCMLHVYADYFSICFFFFWFALQHEKEDLFKTEVLSILVRFKTLSFHSLLIVLNREALHFRTDASGGLRFSFYHCLEISGKAAFFFLQLSNVCCKARNGEARPYIGIKVRYQLKSLSKFYFLFPLLLLGILLSTDRRSFFFFFCAILPQLTSWYCFN